MSISSQIEPSDFIATVEPALQSKDPAALLALLKSHWTAQQIISLLRCDHDDARKVAALCLSLVGSGCCIADLTTLLKDTDPCVNQMAEHALWSIWFRGGSPEANHQLARGAQALGRRDFEHAISHFDRAIELSPEFAEAYNQRSIARFLLDEYEASIADAREAIKRLPSHFGAWAGIGHNYAHLGNLKCAIHAYEKALAINPHMQPIREAVDHLREKADRRD